MTADVIVVGAGPAGCATAIRALAAGLRVLVVERQLLPRERVGETLHPGVEAPLRALGVLDRVASAGFMRHRGVWRVDGEGRHFAAYGVDLAGPWRGYQLWRSQFDELLAERVRELGGRLLTGWRAKRPLLADGRVVGIETSRAPLHAPVVVDAAGSGHWLARCLRLAIVPRAPRLVATYGYAHGNARLAREAPLFAMHDSGWTWIARVRRTTYQWTMLDMDPELPLRRIYPPALASLRRGATRAADVTWRRVEPSVGPGYVLAGDAASVVDPASSHGMLRAMLGGLAAGEVAAGGKPVTEVGRRYAAWLRHGFEHDVSALRELYLDLPRPPPWLAA